MLRETGCVGIFKSLLLVCLGPSRLLDTSMDRRVQRGNRPHFEDCCVILYVEERAGLKERPLFFLSFLKRTQKS